jgi:hypothetical protein
MLWSSITIVHSWNIRKLKGSPYLGAYHLKTIKI